MSGKLVQILNDPLKCAPNSEVGLTASHMRGKGKAGFMDVLLQVDVEATGISSGTISAMTRLQRLAFLATIAFDMRFDVNAKAAGDSTTEAGEVVTNNPFHPQQAAPLDRLRLTSLRVTREEVRGFVDSATNNLATAWTAGAWTRKFTFYASLGRVEQIAKDAEVLLGVGPELLDLMRVVFRPMSDGFKAFNAGLTTTEFKFTPKLLRIPAPAGANLAAIPVMTRRFQSDPDISDVNGTRMVPIDAIQLGEALAATSLGIITVSVGGKVVTQRPETPADVDAVYRLQLVSSSAEDTAISTDVTPVYVVGDVGVEQLLSGVLKAEQETYAIRWNILETGLPSLTEAQTFQLMAALCRNLPAGKRLHFTTSAGLSDYKNLPGNLLPAMGLASWPEGDPRAEKRPGVRMDKYGAWEFYIPPAWSVTAAQDYAKAKQENNAQGMAAACNGLGLHIPGYVTDSEKGYPSEGGAESNVYRGLRSTVESLAAKFQA